MIFLAATKVTRCPAFSALALFDMPRRPDDVRSPGKADIRRKAATARGDARPSCSAVASDAIRCPMALGAAMRPRIHQPTRWSGRTGVCAQQAAMPLVGYLSASSPGEGSQAAAFRRGLERVRLCRGPERGDRIPLGGRSVDRLPAMAADLLKRHVAVIAARHYSGIAAQAATASHSDHLRSGGRPGPAWPRC